MKVVCDRSALLDALTLAQGVTAARTPQPALQCVRLSATPGSLAVAATDLEIALRIGLAQVDVKQEGDAVIPADKLLQIVRASEDATLTIETAKTTMHIRGADSHFKVYGPEVKDFPALPGPAEKGPTCEIPAGSLRRLITRTIFATAVENSRFAINGVLFDRQGRKLRLVATDGRRLALAKGECGSGEGEHRCIVPTKALNVLVRLVDDPEAPIQIAADQGRIRFTVGIGEDAAVLTSVLVEGAFPPFEDVIPKDQDKRLAIDAGELSSAVRRAALLTNEESKGVRFSFADRTLTLSSRAPEMGEAEIHLDLDEYQGESMEIGFNPAFVIDALKHVDGGPVTIELKAPNKPGLIKQGQDFTYVLMPVSLP
ncbi:MAG TPA: DNA polymerase III subunit beta [Phycisphaerales bacterium]|nr:DNA polymerase III subunit beta [Phycisphaerales bacterium]HMP38480.1 DNA polymerase III subunit beta [Phycisphaerales bacterium]